MSDPIDHRPVAPPPQDPGVDVDTRKSASPLIWILILIALLAFGWYFYNRSAGTEATADLGATAPVSDAMTPAPSASAEKEPAAKEPEKKTVAKAEKPRNREVALIGNPKPSYPPEALRAQEEGTVVVSAKIDALGNPGDLEISKRSGSRTLDRAAMNEVRKWKFSPATEGGRAVESTIQVPVDYRLGDAR